MQRFRSEIGLIPFPYERTPQFLYDICINEIPTLVGLRNTIVSQVIQMRLSRYVPGMFYIELPCFRIQDCIRFSSCHVIKVCIKNPSALSCNIQTLLLTVRLASILHERPACYNCSPLGSELWCISTRPLSISFLGAWLL